jgi:hypothetical protein
MTTLFAGCWLVKAKSMRPTIARCQAGDPEGLSRKLHRTWRAAGYGGLVLSFVDHCTDLADQPLRLIEGPKGDTRGRLALA